MKIGDIHIDGFGVWCDKSWQGLAPAVNVFHGPNEAGKSTLMAFVRSILFGFERRGSPRRYEPLKGGAHGGWLDVAVQDRSIRIQRKPGRHIRGILTVQEGDATGGDEALDKLLNGATRTLYHNVFAFGLEELEQFHTLQENEVAQHITGASLGIGAARWSTVQRDIENRQSAIFLPRGHSSAINVALKELESVREELDRTEHQPEDYWAAHEAKTRLTAEVAGLDEAVADLKKRTAYYEKRLMSRPLWEKRRKIEEQLQELPVVENFPEGGVERLDLLRKQRDVLRVEMDRLQREAEERRLRRIELRSLNDPVAYARRAQVVESLRGFGPRMDAVRRVYASTVERRNAVAQEKQTLEATLGSLQPPSLSAFVVFLVLMWITAGGVLATSHEYIAAAILAASIAPILWYRRRSQAIQAVALQLESCDTRLDSSKLELRRVENEGREIESQIRKLTGKTEVTPDDIVVRVAELEQLSKITEEIRRLDEAAERAEGESQRQRNQVVQVQNEVESLLEKGAASNEDIFIERADIYKRRVHLIAELERIPVDVPETGFLFDVRASDEEAYELTRMELAEMEQRLIESRHECGRIDERIATMERSEERSRALSRQETIHAKIDSAADGWAVLTLCRTLLDETRKIYEIDRQPSVLREASSFYSIMTQGAYRRVISPLDGTDVQVERADGARLSPYVLSRGTAEQLYLAMRLALVREYARRVDPLPVVFDDVFVNFDPERSRSTIQAVASLAETHQVLVFTCHPHVVAQFEEIIPQAKLFPLQ